MAKAKKLEDAQTAAVENTVTQPATQTNALPASPETGDDAATEVRKPFKEHKSLAHDNAAGVELMSYVDTSDPENRINQLWLRFRDGDPGEGVTAFMKDTENGSFRWEKNAPKGGGNFDVAGAWVIDYTWADRNAKRYIADKTFDAVRNMMRKERGVEPDYTVIHNRRRL